MVGLLGGVIRASSIYRVLPGLLRARVPRTTLAACRAHANPDVAACYATKAPPALRDRIEGKVGPSLHWSTDNGQAKKVAWCRHGVTTKHRWHAWPTMYSGHSLTCSHGLQVSLVARAITFTDVALEPPREPTPKEYETLQGKLG